jgi:acetylglutamate kinase
MIVIKYGGHALPRAGEPDEILKVIADYHNAGNKVVLVHGGGPQVDAELNIHQISTEMVSGYRSTTPEVFEVVQKVLSGQVLRTLVNQLIGYGANTVGISAGDGGTIRATKMHPVVQGKSLDIGLVGDATFSDGTFLNLLLAHNYLPVVSPVGVDALGQGLNLNGDLAAGAIAGALTADEAIFMTDVAGIYRNFPDASSIISNMTADELRAMQPNFAAGMIPKSKAALAALDAGAKSARVIDGRDYKNLEEALRGNGGTVITHGK